MSSNKLVNVATVNQSEFLAASRFAIRHRQNCLVIGPSGCGKTEISFQACDAEKHYCIYWNLAVSERPDLQGVPSVSPDGLIATYAAPLSLPFVDTRFYQPKLALSKAVDSLNGSKEYTVLKNHLAKQVTQFEDYEKLCALRDALRFVNDEKHIGAIQKKIRMLEEATNDLGMQNTTILFDEVDKAPQEVQQPLLELLLYRTVNGRPLYIGSSILTGNLPDENTYGEPLNHAITNRCMVMELDPDFEVWKAWALDKIHPIILGFLCRTEHQSYFMKRGAKQLFNYSYETPRAWTHASQLITAFEKEEKDLKLANTKDFKSLLIASKVGVEAAEKLSVWADYYREFDPIVDRVFAGEDIDIDKLEDDKMFVFGISLSSKFNVWARANGTPIEEVHDKAKHIYTLINRMPMELQIATLRSTCDVDLFHEKGLDDLPETAKIWEEINQLIRDANSA